MKWEFLDKDGNVIRDVSIEIPLRMKSPEARLYLEELKTGKFRFLWSNSLMEEFKDVEMIRIVRENSNPK